jgi:hypothetical protein
MQDFRPTKQDLTGSKPADGGNLVVAQSDFENITTFLYELQVFFQYW